TKLTASPAPPHAPTWPRPVMTAPTKSSGASSKTDSTPRSASITPSRQRARPAATASIRHSMTVTSIHSPEGNDLDRHQPVRPRTQHRLPGGPGPEDGQPEEPECVLSTQMRRGLDSGQSVRV